MSEKAAFVITYVEHNIGGAAQFKEPAEKKWETVINIAKKQLMMKLSS